MQTALVQRPGIVAVAALALVGSILGARAAGVAGTRPDGATGVAADSCELAYTGYYADDEGSASGYTLWCWDPDWNLIVPAPGHHR